MSRSFLLHCRPFIVGSAFLFGVISCDSDSSSSSNSTSGNSITAEEQERNMAQLIITNSLQGRPRMVENSILANLARKRAEDMAENQYFSHTNLDGLGPNTLARQAGYSLPDFYDQSADGNDIESITGGHSTAISAFSAWLDSPQHVSHILALIPFYADQVEFGIGFAQDTDSPLKYYWVFLSARQ